MPQQGFTVIYLLIKLIKNNYHDEKAFHDGSCNAARCFLQQ